MVTGCHYNGDRLSSDRRRAAKNRRSDGQKQTFGRGKTDLPRERKTTGSRAEGDTQTGKVGLEMPTERFIRLPDEKKKVILEAAMDEFSRVPFDKVSINQIIKNAEISRGSFYTYFEDKMDVLRYIFQDTKRQFQDFCIESLEMNRGDFWKMIVDLFHQVVYRKYSEQLARLFQNVLPYAEAEKFLKILREDFGDGKNMDEWLYEHVDRRGLRVESSEDFYLLVEMCMAAILIAFGQRYKDGEAIETVERSFQRKLNILKNGAQRRPEAEQESGRTL